MNIAHGAVTRPVIVTMRIAAFCLLGIFCLSKLPVDLLPAVSMPVISIDTTWQYVAPEEMESQITRPIEEALSSVSNLYQIRSTSSEGDSNVRLQFNWGTDIGQAMLDTLQLLERAKRNFPTDPTNTLQEPSVYKFDPSQMPILIYGVSGEKDPVKLRMMLDNQVAPILESANGVAAATDSGGLSRAIMVNVDPVRMQAHNLSLATVMNRLAAENVNLPAGFAKVSNTEYTIRSLGWFNNPQEIKTIPMTAPDGKVVTLGEVADVKDASQDQRIFVRMNNVPAAGVTITQQSGANTVATANAVREKLKLVHKLYPNLVFSTAYDQSSFVQDSINDVMLNTVIGGVLAVLILLFFLRSFSSTLVVATSIPTSLVSTFGLIYICGFTLNTMSLGGLALATGLIVDDAVVVLENIYRHVEREKKDRITAAIDGTNEILSAVFASTWTVMVVFLPLLLIKGMSGMMFAQFALVVIFSMSVSLLDAATVVPMLAARLISADAHKEKVDDGLTRRGPVTRMFDSFGRWFDALDETYRRALRWAIHHRWQTIAGALAITLASFSFILLGLIGFELLPQSDSGVFTTTIKLPIGTALSKTDAVMKQVEQIITKNKDVETAFASAGTSGGMRGVSTAQIQNQGSVMVKLRDDKKHSTDQVISTLRKQISVIPGVRPLLNPFDIVSRLMSGGDNSVEVDIFGPDLKQLSNAAEDVMAKVRAIPGAENVDINWEEATPELRWQVDRQKATQLGVSYSDVANTLSTATNGTICTYYQENGFQYPIQVQMPISSRLTVDQMAAMPITLSSGATSAQPVILSQVAHPTYTMGPSQVTRQDRQRYIAVTATPSGGRSSGEVQTDIQSAMGQVKLPLGYYWDWGTNQKMQADQYSGMYMAVILAIALIYMLLASQFESFVEPLIVLCSVPLATSGVILALFLSGRAFGLTAGIGVLMLIGIVVKNGILLVDYTNKLRQRGLALNEAVLRAAPTRLRPILMTACAAMLGMLPIALGIGKGSEIQAPMATAVIGGLVTSTFLTLLVVPVVYTLFDDVTSALSRKKHGVEPDVIAPEKVGALDD